MATIHDLLAQARNDLDAARRRRKTARAAIEALIDGAQRANRSHLTAEEDAQFTRLVADRDAAKDAIDRAEAKVEELQRVALEEAEATRLASQSTPTPAADRHAGAGTDRTIRVGAEERTYRPDRDPRGRQFLSDVMRSHFGRDFAAEERLARHMQEEQIERPEYMERAVGTSAFAGLVVPQYLTELYAPATAALRPLANLANVHRLPPDGMTVNISRITTATSVGLQATEGTAVSETNIDDTLLVENVQTAAGQQSVSRQAVERGTLVEDVVLQDLYARYATALDSTMLNQATTGLSAIAQATAYTDATPTTVEMWPKVFQAFSQGEASFLNMAQVTTVLMHSRRWNWMQSQVGTSWPFMGAGGIPPQQGALVLPGPYGDARPRGILNNGAVVVVDNNISTALGAGTEDEIYVLAPAEVHLWEDPQAPLLIRAEQAKAATLEVLLVIYGYFAYSVRRYTNGHQKVNGTGLIAPTFP
jgi:hypothetical protein